MKKNPSKPLLVISLICLFAIGAIILYGLSKSKQFTNDKQTDFPQVLGQTIESKIMPAAESGVRGVVREIFQNSKEEVSQKTEIVKNEIINTIQKEVSSLTQSQMDALKVQVCRDLGVLPSLTPTP